MDTNEHDPLALSFELTIYGILLALIIPVTKHQLDGASVATIVCFLAAVFVCKMLFLPPRVVLENLWGRGLAIVGCGFFAWCLIYQAEITRMGWYRFHILQTRVQQLVSRSPAYVVTIDSDGMITGTSNNIERLTGYRKDELVGQPSRILMRDEIIPVHEKELDRVVAILQGNEGNTPNAGWGMDGNRAVGVKRKDGKIVPVRVYAGGIRWSEDIRFEGDIDLFAVFIPENIVSAVVSPNSTIPVGAPIWQAPPAPRSSLIHQSVSPEQDNGKPLMSRPGSGGAITPSTPDG